MVRFIPFYGMELAMIRIIVLLMLSAFIIVILVCVPFQVDHASVHF